MHLTFPTWWEETPTQRQMTPATKEIPMSTEAKLLPKSDPVYDPKDTMRMQPKRPLSQQEQEAVNRIKTLSQNLHDAIDELGSSRELSSAKSRLEEAQFWAVKGITS